MSERKCELSMRNILLPKDLKIEKKKSNCWIVTYKDIVVLINKGHINYEGKVLKSGKYSDKVILNLITASINSNLLKIDTVYTQVKGICSNTVAVLLYALLTVSNLSPNNGKVYISSNNGCQAFNCYTKAFKANGYHLKNREKSLEVIKNMKNNRLDGVTFKYSPKIAQQIFNSSPKLIRKSIDKLSSPSSSRKKRV